MQHISTTPFGQRPVSAAILAGQQCARSASDTTQIDKWTVFHDLCTARSDFGVTDRDLSVLNALLSFLPARDLIDGEPLVVFPSNATLAARAHGMAESTLRRHLSALTTAGLIARRDSPNGKRYASRSDPTRAFGFDLRPLLVRATEISAAAAHSKRAAQALHLAREGVVLQLRDAQKLINYGVANDLPGDWALWVADLNPHRTTLRRRLSVRILEDIAEKLAVVLMEIQQHLALKTAQMAVSDSQNERHHTNSNINIQESEPADEPKIVALPAIPLFLVLQACPDIAPYARHPIRHWHDLVACANGLRGMLGINPDTWAEAQRIMGPEAASVVLSAMVQRIDRIKCPGGYLRRLTQKMVERAFSPGPMIMALLSGAKVQTG